MTEQQPIYSQPETDQEVCQSFGTTGRVELRDGCAIKTPLESKFGRLIVREKKLMSKLPPSPFVMPLIRDQRGKPVGNNDEIWMPEFTPVESPDVTGVSLNELATEHIVTFTADLLSGLAHLHTNGIVHGDLRAASTFCYEDESGDVRFLVGDLGYAAVIEDKIGFGTTDKELSGHNSFDDLEREDKTLDMYLPYATDQYASACIIAAAIEGQNDYEQPDYSRDNPKGAIDRFYDMSKFTPKVRGVLEKAGSLYRRDRYSNIEEFRDEILTAMQEEWFNIAVARETINP